MDCLDQVEFNLPIKHRGCHLITTYLMYKLPQICCYQQGMLHLLLTHSSGGLTVHENNPFSESSALESAYAKLNAAYEFDLLSTSDHIGGLPFRRSFIGCEISLPIRDGRLCLGRWQGVHYWEFSGCSYDRRAIATIFGNTARVSKRHMALAS